MNVCVCVCVFDGTRTASSIWEVHDSGMIHAFSQGKKQKKPQKTNMLVCPAE